MVRSYMSISCVVALRPQYTAMVMLRWVRNCFSGLVEAETLSDFLCSPKGEHLVVALSVRLSHFCLEHISKNIEGNLMKLDTLIEGHEENCRMQEM